MCLSLKPTMLWQAPEQAAQPFNHVLPPAQSPAASKGSLRKKLWDLPANAHCPLVGVCLPMTLLQSLLGKAGHVVAHMQPYEQHLVAVGECRRHSRLAEIVQKALDTQFQLTLVSYKSASDVQALRERWVQARAGSHWAADFWAVLTHPKADGALMDEILGDVHMLQHQVGMAGRLDQQQAARQLQAQQAQQQELVQLRERLHAQQQLAQQKILSLQQDVAALQARLTRAEHEVDSAQQQLVQWQSSHSELVESASLKNENEGLRKTVLLLEKSLRRSASPCDAPVAQAVAREEMASPACKPKASWQWLQSPGDLPAMQCVACVGGVAGQVPQYKAVVEEVGAQFVHHDGGIEHKLARLENFLSQADLVICQTGCVSHNAYWRVKEHCKRLGKPCVFVDNPNAQTLRQFMQALPRGSEPAASSAPKT